jgi:hypothetical protein
MSKKSKKSGSYKRKGEFVIGMDIQKKIIVYKGFGIIFYGSLGICSLLIKSCCMACHVR